MTETIAPSVNCDACGQPFAINLVDEPRPGGGVRRVMICPHCSHEYPIAVISRRGLDLQKRIDALKAKSRTPAEERRLAMLLKSVRREVQGASGG